MSAPVFVARSAGREGQQVPLAQLVSGDRVLVGGPEGAHGARAMRLMPGEFADLVDGEGFRLSCEVASTNRERGEVEFKVLKARQEPLRRPELTLVQALAKGGRDELAVQSATELGVDHVVPWQADRSVVRWQPAKRTKAMSKWEAALLSAAKQSRRASIPKLSGLLDTPALVEEVRRWVSDGQLVLVCHEQVSESLRQAVEASGDPKGGVTVIVGPEGGISDSELAALREAGGTPVLLGPEVLRSSSAGPAALVALNLLLGRW